MTQSQRFKQEDVDLPMVDKCSSSDHCINAQAFFYVCLYIKASCKSTFIIFKSICDFVTYSSLNSFNILYKFIKMLFLLFFFFLHFQSITQIMANKSPAPIPYVIFNCSKYATKMHLFQVAQYKCTYRV